MIFPVVEKFVSINGEASRAGELAVFIRFRGCNLGCSYCDTKWANFPDSPAKMESDDQLVDYVESTGIRNVTLTGGEPLLQEGIGVLVEKLGEIGCSVEIETNGSQPIGELGELPQRPLFTLDYKLPSSGMEDFMMTENYRFLGRGDVVKFVVGCRGDLVRAAEVIREFGLTEKCQVYLSPVFGQIQPAEMVDFMAENRLNGVRLQLQLHKFIWDPQERGV